MKLAYILKVNYKKYWPRYGEKDILLYQPVDCDCKYTDIDKQVFFQH